MPPYQDAYPRAGDVAVLCEGDVTGYEISILKRWADQRSKQAPLVDVWPCGTKTSIFGLSDALGRARPIIVIEDRDFRTPDEAQKDCVGSAKSRRRRGVQVLDWRCWRRNEIENYLLEPEVLFKVMTEAFQCTADDVRTALEGVILSQRIYQAALCTLYRVRRAWQKTDPSPVLPNDLQYRPRWDNAIMSPIGPTRAELQNGLSVNAERWKERFVGDHGSAAPVRVDRLLAAFNSKCDEWSGIEYTDRAWLVDWSGKEVLQWLRISLTARFGWFEPTSRSRVKREWAGLSRSKLEEDDREIEGSLRPMFVGEFVEYVARTTVGDIQEEWADIEDKMRGSRER